MLIKHVPRMFIPHNYRMPGADPGLLVGGGRGKQYRFLKKVNCFSFLDLFSALTHQDFLVMLSIKLGVVMIMSPSYIVIPE